MEELKKQVMSLVDNVNQDWVNMLKDAEEKGEGVDLSTMMGKFSTRMKELDEHFRNANARFSVTQGKIKKGGWFG